MGRSFFGVVIDEIVFPPARKVFANRLRETSAVRSELDEANCVSSDVLKRVILVFNEYVPPFYIAAIFQ